METRIVPGDQALKLSDYVASFLAQQGIRHVFAVSGGASLHLIHSLAETPGTTFVCPQHEQAGAMAADAYARVTGNLGAAVGTSGPGATNLITGVCCAYYDSVPVIYITGQVSTFRLRGDLGVRQVGFQETDTVDLFRPITKYAVRVDRPRDIRFELEKACHLARQGRPGPVLVDIPDNVQREQVDPDGLAPYRPPADDADPGRLEADVGRCLELLRGARRPVVILGWGVRLSGADQEVVALVERLGFPVAPTWAVADLLPADHPLLIGTFGTHGTRHANFAVQNADLVLAVGARLETKATGSPPASFAREARKIVVDIDPCELAKFKHFGLEIDLPIRADARRFVGALQEALGGETMPPVADWLGRIADWKRRYPVCPPECYREKTVNPYVFVKRLAEACGEGEVLFVDTGCAVAWMMQAFDFKPGQRLFHDWNNTAMGWALPAAIGASLALGRRPVVCVTGDGSLQMNIQELATAVRHHLPVKIFLLNNHGYSMIQQTQDQWLGSKYLASSVEGGLAFPDFGKVAAAYGFRTLHLDRNDALAEGLRAALGAEGPVFCNVEVRAEHRVIPQVKFGRPNEDAEPFLGREEFLKNMIVQPLDVSLGLPPKLGEVHVPNTVQRALLKMGREIDLMDQYPRSKRPIEERGRLVTDEHRHVARQFGRDYFDGDRLFGYGGYRYHPRFWQATVRRFRDHFRLADDARVLDVGCAKGFMLHDFKDLMPRLTVAGVDISPFAIDNAMETVRPFLRVADARELPFADGSFDLVISINTIHNLPPEECKQALREIQRVGRGHAFLTVDAWRTDDERERLRKWNLTALTYMHVDDWKKLFAEVGYTGDYYWFIAG
jgi:acetolactate synthase-1/2/3 large subunit